MKQITPFQPIDYLVIGHITQDLTPEGAVLGGTASYSALTARALGKRVGIVTACADHQKLPELAGIPIIAARGEYSTTFENIYTATGRIQTVHHVAPMLNISQVPETWRHTPIVHLGPIAQEVDPNLARAFPNSLLCLTLQGWLRNWDQKGHVHFSDWLEANYILGFADIAVLSIDDVRGDERIIEDYASAVRVLVVTEAARGARVFWNGDVRHVNAPTVSEVDATGAGDIFATTFFIRYSQTQDPWEAARFANQIASCSVTRRALESIPHPEEIQANLVEVF
jgi:sugar/nucleoside kinase (ribokinase family)